jgi:hypothetical protein
MKMKNLKYILLISILICSVSCEEDFLNRPSLDQIAEENFWTSESDAFLALNGIYSNLQSSSLYGGSLNGWQGIPGFDGIGDNAFNQFKWEGPGIFMEGTMISDSGPVLAFWTDNYQGIFLANSFIEQMTETDLIEEEEKDALLAQGYFLRALHYFNLSVYFGDVPLITSVQTLEEAFVPKNTYEEIYAQIVEDLSFASQNLPDAHPDNLFGYATRGAALSLFARVQLYNGVYSGENSVLELTDQVLGLGYSLHPNYGELFSLQGETSNEVVFSVRFLREVGANNSETFSGTFQGTPKVDQRPMPNLVNDYYCTDGLPVDESPLFDPSNEGENRDPRANATIYFVGDIFLTDLNREFSGNSPTGYGMRKYIRRQETDDEGVRSFSGGSQDFYVIRYADVLLMRAEAMAETGDVSGAMALVNQVRERVNMPSVQSVEGMVGQSEMVEIVRHERRVELALEGLRFMDLKRWGTVEEGFLRALQDQVGPYNPQYLGDRSKVFPIPQAEIDVNPQLEQHPAW